MAVSVSPFALTVLNEFVGGAAGSGDGDAKASATATAAAAVAEWGYLVTARGDDAARQVVSAIRHGTALPTASDVQSALAGGVLSLGGVFVRRAAASDEASVGAWLKANAAVVQALTAGAAAGDAKDAKADGAAASLLVASVAAGAAGAPAIAYFTYAVATKALTAVSGGDVSTSGGDELSGALLFRTHFERTLYYRHSASSAKHNAAAVEHEFARLRALFAADGSAVSFHFKAADQLFATAQAARDASATVTCADAQSADSKSAAAAGGKSKKGKAQKGVVNAARIEDSAIAVAAYINASAAASSSAPAVVYEPGTARAVRLSFDVLAAVSGQSGIGAGVDALLAGLRGQLARMQTLVLEELTAAPASASSASSAPLHIRALHYKPSTRAYPHTLTLCYPIRPGDVAAGEPSLLAHRTALHEQFALPATRPTLRTVCAIAWGSSGVDSAGRLLNVHRSLGASGVVGGRVSAVDGAYAYHHYMQDKFNDKGWGCAYRTFQTIVSWYQLNHYISASPPSHAQVQQALVDMKEKSATFVGSNEWIGAIELGLVMQHLYGLTGKILPVSSGAEVGNHARALARHFETQGTPIMIGGGQLAYGLLGVDYNEQTGDCKYLILDPHYTGDDDVASIVSKGWCGWKDSKLFLPNAFYNFCQPIRPAVI